ncbi:MAG: hypothetical protein H8E21_05885, partial [Gammaproteobacteria bacterium]|nr:hypothetical protein [Gammaproteobacteria bacterium]
MNLKLLSQMSLLALGLGMGSSGLAADAVEWNAGGGEKDVAMTLTPNRQNGI